MKRRSASKKRYQKGGAAPTPEELQAEISKVYKYITKEIDNVKSSFAQRIADLEMAKFKMGSNIQTLDSRLKQLQLK
jgi:SMC interacting uncharacterized protein involved in chromosome segregation